MENDFKDLLAEVVNSLTKEELERNFVSPDRVDIGGCGERRTMIAYDELAN